MLAFLSSALPILKEKVSFIFIKWNLSLSESSGIFVSDQYTVHLSLSFLYLIIRMDMGTIFYESLTCFQTLILYINICDYVEENT